MKSASVFIACILVATCGFAEAGIGGSGQNGTGENPWIISSLADFHTFCSNTSYWDDHTRLDCDLDLSSAGTYDNAPIAGDTDIDLAFDGTVFSGSFDGSGHTIRNLKVNGANFCALFGKIAAGSEIKNLTVENVSINGTGNYIGGLASISNGTITNCHSTGTVKTFNDYVGGLVGLNEGPVTNSSSTATVNGDDFVGGLAGKNTESISKSHSTGDVDGDNNTGGLAGSNSGTVTRCYSTGNVDGLDHVGGLTGRSEGDIISCYSTGAITGMDDYVGGLVGTNVGEITNSYAIGSAYGNSYIGGLVGRNDEGTIASSYSTGPVDGTGNPRGGFVGGSNVSTFIDCFWDVTTSEMGTAGDTNFGATGKTTGQMQDINTFVNAGWDFDFNDGDMEDWIIKPGSYPDVFWNKECMYHLAGDLNKDCKIDLQDLAIMAGNWLINCIADPTNSVCIPY